MSTFCFRFYGFRLSNEEDDMDRAETVKADRQTMVLESRRGTLQMNPSGTETKKPEPLNAQRSSMAPKKKVDISKLQVS